MKLKKKIKKNLSKVLNTFENMMENGANNLFSIIFSNMLNFEGIKRCYYGVIGRGAQWLSGRALDPRPKGGGFEPHKHPCVVSLSKTH